ncbi:MAG TPA: CDP-alcohol phosphatidyltransferase family protein [candidate division Zixibacteria bacterium]|nr:CDP-alcohol phosphatidyltransferase family protein [candidate division Zixibacteria bacterium]MDD4917920.1 CDP-alcohol phosphatidyltransferase family protein [candidate division Zixibacteria bacterium]MDM7972528.1 CDP-alcohol phosphatidyltransferase family protein [candidate division Zixibacteria bacterium]HOD65217.1 CDP-alcohol phosphatidyltransferase family protein [candidate division Zixibacteria bacterium]HOZ08491.1 CDP-alcohol phosphatidyltransferase family protein [candidate division Z
MISWREIGRLPNLLSLSRIAMTPLIGYFLWLDTPAAPFVCVGFLFLAAVTDGLDGYLARRRGLTSDLGRVLDPVADKIMAGVLVLLLVAYRGFPLWLAVVILGRDLLIMAAGLFLLQGRKVVLGSNITGKYTFTAIAFLLGSYVIRFPFGMLVMPPITLALIAFSMILYARVFLRVRRGDRPAPEHDRPGYKMVRVTLLVLFLVIFAVQLAEYLW